MTLLIADKVQAGYDGSQVLFDVDLQIDIGACVSLQGRNGMGKSTLLKVLTGILPLRSGALAIDDQPVSGWPAHRIARQGVALVPEGRQIFPNLTARENLLATARAGKQAPARANWTLDRVLALFPALVPRLGAMGNLLSGGEQQMLAIGRALMINPRLLLLDDATEGLAPQVRHEIWQVLMQLRTDGLAIIVVDKHLDALLKLADWHCILENGRVVWQGDSAALRTDTVSRDRLLGV